MNELEMYSKALMLATEAHMYQTRKDKKTPYISHPIAVANVVRDQGYDVRYQTVAFLHDVLEDTDHTEEEIRFFGEDILEAVKLLTRPEGADESEYVARILENHMAAVVKNADKICNLWDAMYEGVPGEKRADKVRDFVEKYLTKTRTYYTGKFSRALDISISKVEYALKEELIRERKHPDFSREEMKLYID
jgi:(p)ppGpp synthase/HD superfamily hydrolase